MNVDIRLSIGFWQHPKTNRLERQIGLKGIRSLQILWFWCAQNRPDGILEDFDSTDIEFVADWRGKKGLFADACVACGSLDQTDSGYSLHEWEKICPSQDLHTGRAWDVTRAEWENLRNAIFSRDKYVCQYCGKKIHHPDCDHVVPISKGGKSVLDNLVTACPFCNRSKGSKSLQEWCRGLV